MSQTQLRFDVRIDPPETGDGIVTVSHDLGPIRAFRPDEEFWNADESTQRARAIARYVEDVRVLETDPDRISDQLDP